MQKTKALLLGFAAVCLALTAFGAQAAFHLQRIKQIYSNADGTVQFIILSATDDGESFWSGHNISSVGGSNGGQSFTFPTDLPSGATSFKSILIATQGFANLGLIAPDYIVPNNFVPLGSGTIDFAGVDSVSYSPGELPTDGIHSMARNGSPMMNLATNFAGASASISAGGGGAAVNYQGLWWKADESGWGVNFVHQGDRVFATWYTYDTTGAAYWLSMLASRTTPTGSVYSGDIYVDVGPAFNNYSGAASATKVGTGTLTFSDANSGTFDYLVSVSGESNIQQSKAITRFSLGGAQPACTFGASPNFAAATNYQDLWWVPAESGWGANFAHQGDLMFATWYTFGATFTGSNGPLWLSALLQRQGTSNVFTGSLTRTSGPRFDNYKPPYASQTVGTLTATFTDGNHAAFHYITNGTGGLPAVDQTKSITRFLFAGPAGTVCQ